MHTSPNVREISQAMRSESKAASARTPPRVSIPLLSGLTPSQSADVLGRARMFRASSKHRLCTAGDKAESLFVLIRGRIKVSRTTADGTEIVVRLLTPSECIGLATLLPDPPHYLGTAETVFPSELMVWNHADILQLADRYHQIKTNALSIALQYLGALSDRHSSLFEGDASHRVARALIDVSRRSGQIHPQGIGVHITNEQLGSLADVNLYTASRVLSEWKKRGIITKSRETVIIHSPEALLAD